MDIDDDRAIYLLTKIKKSLLKIREHGRYSDVYDVESNLLIIENLLKHSWKKRGHLPGFNKLNNIIFDREDDFNPLKINLLFDKLAKTEHGNYVNKLIEVLENPNDSGVSEDQLLDEIDELKRQLRLKKVSLIDYLKISMLNITKNQFRRILKGVIGETKRTFKEICDNPYLIYEEYEAKEEEDAYFGDRIDGPIIYLK